MSVLKVRPAEAFAPLWTTRARYKGAWGGRGSGKSHDRAEHLIVRCVTGFERAVCIREVQKSLKESVKQLLEDKIQRLGVGHLFEVQEDRIKAPHGGLITFLGMKDMNAENVKSLEGFTIAWVEEAQTFSARSLELLRPTIRAPGAEMWFTWNPRFKTDPVDRLLRGAPPDDSVVIKANYTENPWFPDDLRADMEADRRADPDRAAHVWDGAYEAESDQQFITAKAVWAARKREAISHPHDELILGVDVARFGDDASVIYPRRGRDARTLPYELYRKMDTMRFAARVAAAIERWRPDAVFVDEGGVGGGVVDRLRQLGHDVVPVNFGDRPDYEIVTEKVVNKRTEMWAAMRAWLKGGAIPDEDAVENDMTGPLYAFDENNAMALERKKDMKKRGVPSPDIADALALTFAHPVVPRGEQDRVDEAREDDYDPMER